MGLQKSEKARKESVTNKEKDELYGELIEPDAFEDDLAVRRARDISQHTSFNPQDPQPLFGVPLLGDLAANAYDTRKDYLHQIPDESKYRSTFHPMRNPDTVKDDAAFRALRKDSNLYSDPESLGIFKDPNISPYVSSCWKHQIDESVSRCSKDGRQSPTVFYPNRNNKVMQSLSNNAVMQIKKQSVQAGAGDPDAIITYDDLLNDPDLMEAVKYNLGITGNNNSDALDETDCNDGTEDKNLAWKGKTLFELFHENHIILRKVKNETYDHEIGSINSQESQPSVDSNITSQNGLKEDIVVQICMIDHNHPFEGLKDNWRIVRKKEEGLASSKTDKDDDCPKVNKIVLSSSVAEELEPSSSSAMRALEREDSSSTEDKNTTVVYVPNTNNKSCDNNDKQNATTFDGELESLDNIASIIPDTIMESTNAEPVTENSPEFHSAQSASDEIDSHEGECDKEIEGKSKMDDAFSSEGIEKQTSKE